MIKTSFKKTLFAFLAFSLCQFAFASGGTLSENAEDAWITITNNTPVPLYLYGETDYLSNSNNAGGMRIANSDPENDGCTSGTVGTGVGVLNDFNNNGETNVIAPGQQVLVHACTGSNLPEAGQNNIGHGIYHIWGLNGTILFLNIYSNFNNGNNWPGSSQSVLQDVSGCNQNLYAEASPANSGQTYPSCPSGYTQSGSLCMEHTYDSSTSDDCWMSADHYSVIVQGATSPYYRNSP